MATDKQIAANRANAQRSTGPRTLAGRQRSSQNAYRHGLSQSVPQSFGTTEEVQRLAASLVQPDAETSSIIAAEQLAEAQLELSRVAAIRNGLIAGMSAEEPELRVLKTLVGLDRYEKRALTKRRRAGQRL